MLKRDVLWWMTSFLLFCNTLVTININIAIVSMANGRSAEGSKNQTNIAVCPNVSFFMEEFFATAKSHSANAPEFVSVPAGIYSIMGNWIPSNERGKFGTSYLLGGCAAATLGSLVFGYVARYLHWTYVFHLTSVCGIVWSILWYNCIYDYPARHPTISLEELKHIENNLKNFSVEKGAIPWRCIFTSVPFLVCVLGWCSGMWIVAMLLTYVPVYLNTIYGLNSGEIGMIIGFTNLLRSVVVIATGYCCDLAVKKGMISVTNTRKICAFTGTAICAVPLVFATFMRCNLTTAVVCVVLANASKSVSFFGAGLAVIDLSPKFSGVLEGISGTAYCLVTFAFVIGINYLTVVLDIETLWNTVFLATSFFFVFSGLMFVFFGSAEVQRWNVEGDPKIEERVELSRAQRN